MEKAVLSSSETIPWKSWGSALIHGMTLNRDAASLVPPPPTLTGYPRFLFAESLYILDEFWKFKQASYVVLFF